MSLLPEDLLRAAAAADAGDHGSVVLLVREDDRAGDELHERRQRRVVGDIGGGEQERRLLAVQVGELLLQQHMVVVGARDVARAAGAGAAALDGFVHGGAHHRVLAHAEIVVGAPDRDLALAVRRVVRSAREAAGMAFDIGEDAVATFPAQTVEALVQQGVVVHHCLRGVEDVGCSSARSR